MPIKLIGSIQFGTKITLAICFGHQLLHSCKKSSWASGPIKQLWLKIFEMKNHKTIIYWYLNLNYHVCSFSLIIIIRSFVVYKAVKIWDMGGCESAWNILLSSADVALKSPGTQGSWQKSGNCPTNLFSRELLTIW